MSSLIDELKQVPDFRKDRGKSHPLWILLVLIIMGILSGYHGFRPLQTFCQEHQNALSELLGVQKLKVPSYSTFRRVMMGLDFLALSQCFESWMADMPLVQAPDNAVTAIDGKRIRQSMTDENGKQRFIGLVSLFGVESGLTVKVEALTEQDNSELKVVQTLLEALEVDGLLISMDALHAQKKTLKLVLDSGNDYLVTVKSNQGRLYSHLQTYPRYFKPIAEHTDTHQARGRQEYRQVTVYRPGGLALDEWPGVRSIVCVKRWGTRQGKPYEHNRYYVSSALTSAAQWQGLVRGHWGIENRLHWPKDVVFGEDDYRLEDPKALLNWSVFRTIGINVLRLSGFPSLKGALTKLANQVDEIFALLT